MISRSSLAKAAIQKISAILLLAVWLGGYGSAMAQAVAPAPAPTATSDSTTEFTLPNQIKTLHRRVEDDGHRMSSVRLVTPRPGNRPARDSRCPCKGQPGPLSGG